MDNVFLKYMRERVGKMDQTQFAVSEGPVITISREYGCPGKRIGEHLSHVLSDRLRREGADVKWRWLSKEILEESARELKLTPSLVKDLAEYKNRSFFENIALFFSEAYYPSDSKINNTIANFIHTAASEGNVVIVGRAAEAITKKFKKSFHVKLIAPLDWRAEEVCKNEGITLSEAKRECQEMDRRRAAFRAYFEKGVPDIQFYDAFFNCKEMCDDEIVEMMVVIAETRGFV
ncbi:cytidylate kinase-like family protein [Saccharicrinis fermentans]|uniref:Cytidylate kinase n=1 Tax=Saccharicrinis fermentans DSM 9555 = JCM 21142 TaxID=869213 RepID=W7XYL4_9BACT|nr:cytidylate kinase-like family protein [Saccharicrinis fermentans]GAF03720.1 cytidylate kinase [Saccharicrinis fermentans DSM 9555 = JCM 21142]